MHARKLARFLGLLISLTALIGCGGDDAPPPDSGAPLMDQCLAATDMDIVLAARSDAGTLDGGPEDPLHVAGQCALTDACSALYFGGDIEGGNACVDDCIDQSSVAGLSASCRACYGVDARACAAANCLIECVGTDQVMCNACFAAECQERLTTCIGY